MTEKRIVIDINEVGEIKAETFGMKGTECIAALDKILNDLALKTETTKKEEFFKEGTTTTNTINAKNT